MLWGLTHLEDRHVECVMVRPRTEEVMFCSCLTVWPIGPANLFALCMSTYYTIYFVANIFVILWWYTGNLVQYTIQKHPGFSFHAFVFFRFSFLSISQSEFRFCHCYIRGQRIACCMLEMSLVHVGIAFSAYSSLRMRARAHISTETYYNCSTVFDDIVCMCALAVPCVDC